MDSAATMSAVTVVVPAALPAVAAHRHLDRAAVWGVPPHVTIVYPFAAPARLDATLLDRLAEVVSTVPAFAVTFARTDWFGSDVLFLVPEPDEGFRALTTAVWAAFPDSPPYGGEFAEPVPHLTVGHVPYATPDELRAAERAIAPALPVRSVVDHVDVLIGRDAPDSWHSIARLPLG